MGTCDICGASEAPLYNCNYCDLSLCSDHRLPEKHACVGLGLSSDSKHFESEGPSTDRPTSDSSNRRSKDHSEPEPTNTSKELPTAAKDPPRSSSPAVTTKSDAGDGSVDWSKSQDSNAGKKSTRKRISDGLGSVILAPFMFLFSAWGMAKSIMSRIASGLWKVLKYPVSILTSPKFWVLGLLLGGAAFVLAPGGPTPQDITSGIADTGSDLVQSGSDALNTTDEVNTTKVEYEIHVRINQIRKNRGLQPLNHDPALRKIAREHSQNMAEEGFFAHEAPDGDTFEDRYRQAGYDCRVYISDNRYVTGAENIAYTYAYTEIDTEYAGDVSYNGNETKIARGIVRSWMHSPGHRKNILRPYWENEGIGVAVAEVDGQTKVFATQNFC